MFFISILSNLKASTYDFFLDLNSCCIFFHKVIIEPFCFQTSLYESNLDFHSSYFEDALDIRRYGYASIFFYLYMSCFIFLI